MWNTPAGVRGLYSSDLCAVSYAYSSMMSLACLELCMVLFLGWWGGHRPCRGAGLRQSSLLWASCLRLVLVRPTRIRLLWPKKVRPSRPGFVFRLSRSLTKRRLCIVNTPAYCLLPMPGRQLKHCVWGWFLPVGYRPIQLRAMTSSIILEPS